MRATFTFGCVAVAVLASVHCGGNVVVDPTRGLTSGTTSGAGGSANGSSSSVTNVSSSSAPSSSASSSSASSASSSSGSMSCLPRAPSVHRVAGTACKPAGMACMSDADCEMADGRGGILKGTCTAAAVCDYNTCVTDADCPASTICECSSSSRFPPVAACIAAKCRTDAECASGYCSPDPGAGCGVEWACHTCKDACVDDSDCSSMSGQRCALDAALGYWACSFPTCAG